MFGDINATVAAAFLALGGVLAAQVITVWLDHRKQVADTTWKTHEDALERITTTRSDAATARAEQELGVSRISGAIQVARQIESLSLRDDDIPASALKPPSITEQTRQVGGDNGTAAMIELWHQWHVYKAHPTAENRRRLTAPAHQLIETLTERLTAARAHTRQYRSVFEEIDRAQERMMNAEKRQEILDALKPVFAARQRLGDLRYTLA